MAYCFRKKQSLFRDSRASLPPRDSSAESASLFVSISGELRRGSEGRLACGGDRRGGGGDQVGASMSMMAAGERRRAVDAVGSRRPYRQRQRVVSSPMVRPIAQYLRPIENIFSFSVVLSLHMF